MSVSVFYAVRFSPAPKLGEWLNVAVIGESIEEKRAGVKFGTSIDRVRRAFGGGAAYRVVLLQEDLSSLAARLELAHQQGQPTSSIPSAQADKGLSLSFSEEIVVFEGTFEESLDLVAADFLGGALGDEISGAKEMIGTAKRPNHVESPIDLDDIDLSVPVFIREHRQRR